MELSHLSHDWGVWQKPEHRETNWQLSHQEEPGIYRGWPGGTLQRNMSCAVFPWVYPDSKVHGANMGPTWSWQDPCGPHVGPMNFDIWVYAYCLWYWLILLISFRITLLVGQSYGYPSTNEVTLKNTSKWFAGIAKDVHHKHKVQPCLHIFGTSCIVLYTQLPTCLVGKDVIKKRFEHCMKCLQWLMCLTLFAVPYDQLLLSSQNGRWLV